MKKSFLKFRKKKKNFWFQQINNKTNNLSVSIVGLGD